ncbi:MAG TPA: 2-oxoacid:acceptor oxidoreductase family protein, partial [Chloroflexota bacterium]|nr:2-oxoacid:acceptor oxidoreductase family protein [Chloroflexota bacterium]
SLEILGQDRPNMVILGALAAATGLIEFSSLEKAIVANFGKGAVADKNVQAARKAYDIVAGGTVAGSAK